MQRDEFFWTSTINKATIVVNAAEGLLSKEAAREAAGGVARLEAKAEKDPALRVKSYIAYEPLLIAETSPAVTLIHAGRSSQDILSTQRTAILRDRTVQVAKAFDAVIGKLLDLAEANRHTIVPNYTNGVAAQPNSYAHASAFRRRAATPLMPPAYRPQICLSNSRASMRPPLCTSAASFLT